MRRGRRRSRNSVNFAKVHGVSGASALYPRATALSCSIYLNLMSNAASRHCSALIQPLAFHNITLCRSAFLSVLQSPDIESLKPAPVQSILVTKAWILRHRNQGLPLRCVSIRIVRKKVHIVDPTPAERIQLFLQASALRWPLLHAHSKFSPSITPFPL